MTNAVQSSPQRCGFVAIVGAPNAGKSTLLNGLVESKVSIVSPKAQTTRTRVLGIVIEGASQIIFVDTPGIFQPRRRLDRAMVAAAWQGAADAEHVLLLVDASRKGPDEETSAIIEKLRDAHRPVILVLNKIDAVPREKLLLQAEALNQKMTFQQTFMISALKGDGVADIRRYLAGQVPPGPWLYPEDQMSDMPMRLLAAEITREKIFFQLQQELPYACTVETEAWEEKDNGTVHISQVIYVQKESQKAIVVGKGGQRIKSLGTAARRELEEILGQRVHLALFVKVREDWAEKSAVYSLWGLDFKA